MTTTLVNTTKKWVDDAYEGGLVSRHDLCVWLGQPGPHIYTKHYSEKETYNQGTSQVTVSSRHAWSQPARHETSSSHLVPSCYFRLNYRCSPSTRGRQLLQGRAASEGCENPGILWIMNFPWAATARVHALLFVGSCIPYPYFIVHVYSISLCDKLAIYDFEKICIKHFQRSQTIRVTNCNHDDCDIKSLVFHNVI